MESEDEREVMDVLFRWVLGQKTCPGMQDQAVIRRILYHIAVALKEIYVLCPCEDDMMARLRQRVESGRDQYGWLNLATDGRDFFNEATAELLDACFYIAAAALKRQRQITAA